MQQQDSERADRIRNVIELGLLCAQRPLDAAGLQRLFAAGEKVAKRDTEEALDAIGRLWQGRALELAQAAGGWQLRTREEFSAYAGRLQEQAPPRLSRPMLEVLAIVAYNEGVTRGDIESIRGVTTSAGQLATLEELGWVEVTGRRDTPGRPLLYGTTKQFLEDLGLDSLAELPPLEDFEVPEDAARLALGGSKDSDTSSDG